MTGRLGPYEYELDTIVIGDCLDVMGRMPDDCVDAVITDPPYGTGTRTWDVEPSPEIWAEIRRLTKPDGTIAVMGYAKQLFGWARFFEDLSLIGFVVWHKYNEPMISPGLTRMHQDIAIWGRSLKQLKAGEVREPYSECAHLADWYYGKQGKYNKEPTDDLTRRLRASLKDDSKRRERHPDGRRCSDLWKIPAPGAGFNAHLRNHPNEKPLELLTRLIRLTTNEDDLVFDPFVGSGTTAVAAKSKGRHYFGCDINPAYVEMARERVARTQLEMSL